MKTNADYYNNRRTEIYSLISPQARRILDVGCGFGVLGSTLKEELGAEVWGVEMEPDCADRASKVLDRFLKGSIESHMNMLPESYFDAIIFADVLEHLYNPWKVLKDIRSKIAKGGEVIVSIPNVGHWFVIKQLLQGRMPTPTMGCWTLPISAFSRENPCCPCFKTLNCRSLSAARLPLSGSPYPMKLSQRVPPSASMPRG